MGRFDYLIIRDSDSDSSEEPTAPPAAVPAVIHDPLEAPGLHPMPERGTTLLSAQKESIPVVPPVTPFGQSQAPQTRLLPPLWSQLSSVTESQVLPVHEANVPAEVFRQLGPVAAAVPPAAGCVPTPMDLPPLVDAQSLDGNDKLSGSLPFRRTPAASNGGQSASDKPREKLPIEGSRSIRSFVGTPTSVNVGPPAEPYHSNSVVESVVNPPRAFEADAPSASVSSDVCSVPELTAPSVREEARVTTVSDSVLTASDDRPDDSGFSMADASHDVEVAATAGDPSTVAAVTHSGESVAPAAPRPAKVNLGCCWFTVCSKKRKVKEPLETASEHARAAAEGMVQAAGDRRASLTIDAVCCEHTPFHPSGQASVRSAAESLSSLQMRSVAEILTPLPDTLPSDVVRSTSEVFRSDARDPCALGAAGAAPADKRVITAMTPSTEEAADSDTVRTVGDEVLTDVKASCTANNATPAAAESHREKRGKYRSTGMSGHHRSASCTSGDLLSQKHEDPASRIDGEEDGSNVSYSYSSSGFDSGIGTSKRSCALHTPSQQSDRHRNRNHHHHDSHTPPKHPAADATETAGLTEGYDLLSHSQDGICTSPRLFATPVHHPDDPELAKLPAYQRRLLLDQRVKEQRALEELAKEWQELTFHPKIHPSPYKHITNNIPFGDRLSRSAHTIPSSKVRQTLHSTKLTSEAPSTSNRRITDCAENRVCRQSSVFKRLAAPRLREPVALSDEYTFSPEINESLRESPRSGKDLVSRLYGLSHRDDALAAESRARGNSLSASKTNAQREKVFDRLYRQRKSSNQVEESTSLQRPEGGRYAFQPNITAIARRLSNDEDFGERLHRGSPRLTRHTPFHADASNSPIEQTIRSENEHSQGSQCSHRTDPEGSLCSHTSSRSSEHSCTDRSLRRDEQPVAAPVGVPTSTEAARSSSSRSDSALKGDGGSRPCSPLEVVAAH